MSSNSNDMSLILHEHINEILLKANIEESDDHTTLLQMA